MPGDLRVCWYQVVCPEPIYFLAQQVEPQPSVFELRPWNNFSEKHQQLVHKEEDNEKLKSKEQSCLKKMNLWMRISDFILDKISHDEIMEILELKVRGSSENFLQKILNDKMKDLSLLKHFRYILGIFLVAQLILALHIYNKALSYFFEQQLRMPESLAKTFGVYIGSKLRSTDN